jgi:serine acetyltransferase
MTSRGSGRLEVEITAPPMSFLELIWSDYEASLMEHDEATSSTKLLYLPRLLLNPSLQLAFLVRLAQKGPRILLHVIRWLQVVLFSSEVYRFYGDDAIVLGPAIAFPHPFNVIIGGGTMIGAGVTIYNNNNIGGNRHAPYGGAVSEAARIGDRAVIYAYSVIQGPYDVGEDAVVGLHVVLDDHVPPGALRSYRKLRLAGEWPGEDRRAWRMRRPPALASDDQ